MDTFLEYKEFINNFFKEHLKQATSVAFQQIDVKGFGLKSAF